MTDHNLLVLAIVFFAAFELGRFTAQFNLRRTGGLPRIARDPIYQDLFQRGAEGPRDLAQPIAAEPEPERAGRVVEASPNPPTWRPNQRGGVIVAEPTEVANERRAKERT